MIGTGELFDYYKTNMLLFKEHNMSLTEIEELLPFERNIYIALIKDYQKKKAIIRAQ